MTTKFDHAISVRVEPELRKQLEAAAAKDRRPLGPFVRNLLADALAPSAPRSAQGSEVQ